MSVVCKKVWSNLYSYLHNLHPPYLKIFDSEWHLQDIYKYLILCNAPSYLSIGMVKCDKCDSWYLDMFIFVTWQRSYWAVNIIGWHCLGSPREMQNGWIRAFLEKANVHKYSEISKFELLMPLWLLEKCITIHSILHSLKRSDLTHCQTFLNFNR